MASPFSRAHVTNALRYWETGRIGYNLVLLVMTLGYAFATGEKWAKWLKAVPDIIALGVVANVLYLAVYPIDLLFQAGASQAWARSRWILWIAGTLLAASLAALALPEVLVFA